jgi:hypothetical protein
MAKSGAGLESAAQTTVAYTRSGISCGAALRRTIIIIYNKKNLKNHG